MQIGPKQDVKNLQLGIGSVAGFLIRITPTCREMTRLLSEGMDRSLPLMTRVKIRLHFLICKWCERYKHQLLVVRNAIRRHPEKLEGNDSSMSADLSSVTKERLKEALRQRR